LSIDLPYNSEGVPSADPWKTGMKVSGKSRHMPVSAEKHLNTGTRLFHVRISDQLSVQEKSKNDTFD